MIEASSTDARNGRITAGNDLTAKSTQNLSLNDGRDVSGGMLLAQAAQLTSSASFAARSVAKLETLGGNLNHFGEIAGNGGTVLSSAQDKSEQEAGAGSGWRRGMCRRQILD
ncbi:hypothetical protein [Rhizobium sp. NFACC06-2]|uniref:hypothetical protein n=1 Tax=Rhizobium sp. NFACC06-2 TaxID=1566264 RepID=UPI00165F5C28|nr:hypothetical protein [Rhizobium sp. NFACC06-2]